MYGNICKVFSLYQIIAFPNHLPNLLFRYTAIQNNGIPVFYAAASSRVLIAAPPPVLPNKETAFLYYGNLFGFYSFNPDEPLFMEKRNQFFYILSPALYFHLYISIPVIFYPACKAQHLSYMHGAVAKSHSLNPAGKYKMLPDFFHFSSRLPLEIFALGFHNPQNICLIYHMAIGFLFLYCNTSNKIRHFLSKKEIVPPIFTR